MAINKELNENELENVLGTSIKAQDLPSKFKQYKKEELSEESLTTVIGGPIKAEDLPDWAYTDKNKELSTKK